MARRIREGQAPYEIKRPETELPGRPPAPNWTAVPNVVFDQWLAILGFAELKVYLYLIRRIRGFHKQHDAISLAQMERGLLSRDSRQRLDRGTGLAASNIRTALNKLIEYGLVSSLENWTEFGSRAPTTYALNWQASDECYSDAVQADHEADRA
jgi:hypothetical protein